LAKLLLLEWIVVGWGQLEIQMSDSVVMLEMFAMVILELVIWKKFLLGDQVRC